MGLNIKQRRSLEIFALEKFERLSEDQQRVFLVEFRPRRSKYKHLNQFINQVNNRDLKRLEKRLFKLLTSPKQL